MSPLQFRVSIIIKLSNILNNKSGQVYCVIDPKNCLFPYTAFSKNSRIEIQHNHLVNFSTESKIKPSEISWLIEEKSKIILFSGFLTKDPVGHKRN